MNDRVDSVTLTEVIDRCLDYSMDGRFTQERRSEFLALAKRLRGSLLNLLSARFNAGTPGLQQANADLTTINTRLKAEAETLAKAAQVLADLAKLVASLDKLLSVAGSFL
jgi:hypothetical protein